MLKSSAKEEDYPTFTPEDVIFLFDEIAHPEGVILKWRIYLILIKNPLGWGFLCC